MEVLQFEAEAQFFRENGYVIFRNHLAKPDCEILTRVGLETLFAMAFGSKEGTPEPSFENLKFFASSEERKKLRCPTCVWVNGKAHQPLCSKVTGLCYGSYLKEVQSKFTMTLETYEKLVACYGSAEIAQIYGPKRYSIRMKGGHKSQTMMECNLLSDFNNACPDEKVLSSLIVSVDENAEISATGTICLIPKFNVYRRHARIFFNFVGGERKLPLNLSAPMLFEDEFLDENLPAFNELLSDLHHIRDGVIKPSKIHEPYLKLPLPDTFEELRWKPLRLRVGDLLCRSQWLPYYENACTVDTPLIAFHVGYYLIPDDFLGSYKQRRLVEALEAGYTMEECKEWEKAKNNTYERYLRRGREKETTYFYVPDNDEDLDFAMYIQCLDPALSTTQLGMDLE